MASAAQPVIEQHQVYEAMISSSVMNPNETPSVGQRLALIWDDDDLIAPTENGSVVGHLTHSWMPIPIAVVLMRSGAIEYCVCLRGEGNPEPGWVLLESNRFERPNGTVDQKRSQENSFGLTARARFSQPCTSAIEHSGESSIRLSKPVTLQCR